MHLGIMLKKRCCYKETTTHRSIKNVLLILIPKEHAGLLGLLLSGGTQHLALLFFVDDIVDLSTNVEA